MSKQTREPILPNSSATYSLEEPTKKKSKKRIFDIKKWLTYVLQTLYALIVAIVVVGILVFIGIHTSKLLFLQPTDVQQALNSIFRQSMEVEFIICAVLTGIIGAFTFYPRWENVSGGRLFMAGISGIILIALFASVIFGIQMQFVLDPEVTLDIPFEILVGQFIIYVLTIMSIPLYRSITHIDPVKFPQFPENVKWIVVHFRLFVVIMILIGANVWLTNYHFPVFSSTNIIAVLREIGIEENLLTLNYAQSLALAVGITVAALFYYLPPYHQFERKRTFVIFRFIGLVLGIGLWGTLYKSASFDTAFLEATIASFMIGILFISTQRTLT